MDQFAARFDDEARPATFSGQLAVLLAGSSGRASDGEGDGARPRGIRSALCRPETIRVLTSHVERLRGRASPADALDARDILTDLIGALEPVNEPVVLGAAPAPAGGRDFQKEAEALRADGWHVGGVPAPAGGEGSDPPCKLCRDLDDVSFRDGWKRRGRELNELYAALVAVVGDATTGDPIKDIALLQLREQAGVGQDAPAREEETPRRFIEVYANEVVSVWQKGVGYLSPDERVELAEQIADGANRARVLRARRAAGLDVPAPSEGEEQTHG